MGGRKTVFHIFLLALIKAKNTVQILSRAPPGEQSQPPVALFDTFCIPRNNDDFIVQKRQRMQYHAEQFSRRSANSQLLQRYSDSSREWAEKKETAKIFRHAFHVAVPWPPWVGGVHRNYWKDLHATYLSWRVTLNNTCQDKHMIREKFLVVRVERGFLLVVIGGSSSTLWGIPIKQQV